MSGGVAQRYGYLPLDYLRLSYQKFPAAFDFLRVWGSVTRWTAFQYVADVDILSRHAHGLDHFCKQLTCSSYERPTGYVFIHSGSFPDKDKVRIAVTFTENGIRPVPG